MFGLNLVYTSLCVDCSVNIYKLHVFLSGYFRQAYRVTDRDLMSETASLFVLLSFFLKKLTFDFYMPYQLMLQLLQVLRSSRQQLDNCSIPNPILGINLILDNLMLDIPN